LSTIPKGDSACPALTMQLKQRMSNGMGGPTTGGRPGRLMVLSATALDWPGGWQSYVRIQSGFLALSSGARDQCSDTTIVLKRVGPPIRQEPRSLNGNRPRAIRLIRPKEKEPGGGARPTNWFQAARSYPL